jgi:hypothetical protein
MLLTTECVITEVKKRRTNYANGWWNAGNDVTQRVAETIYILTVLLLHGIFV